MLQDGLRFWRNQEPDELRGFLRAPRGARNRRCVADRLAHVDALGKADYVDVVAGGDCRRVVDDGGIRLAVAYDGHGLRHGGGLRGIDKRRIDDPGRELRLAFARRRALHEFDRAAGGEILLAVDPDEAHLRPRQIADFAGCRADCPCATMITISFAENTTYHVAASCPVPAIFLPIRSSSMTAGDEGANTSQPSPLRIRPASRASDGWLLCVASDEHVPRADRPRRAGRPCRSCVMFEAGEADRQSPIRFAIAQATSATSRARLPVSIALRLAALPCSARASTPCRIAAMRNMLKMR